jgi:hypothetical protein
MCTDQRIIQSRLKDFEFDVYMRARMAEPFWRQTHIIGWIWMSAKDRDWGDSDLKITTNGNKILSLQDS